MATSATDARAEILRMLGAAMGEARAVPLVDETCTRLGYSRTELTFDQAFAVLEALARMPGLVGLTAQLARTQLRLSRTKRRLGIGGPA